MKGFIGEGETGEDDLATESSGPKLLLQQMMLTATQPSPLKAAFTKAEIEVNLYFAFGFNEISVVTIPKLCYSLVVVNIYIL